MNAKLIALAVVALAAAASADTLETNRRSSTDGVGSASFNDGRRPVVVIPDYLATNGVVSADRSLTEALRDAGFLPFVLPETDQDSVRRTLLQCDAVMIGGGAKEQDYVRRCAFEDMVISLAAERNLPIVGVCHGAQVINRHFGGTLETVPAKGGVVHQDAELFKRTTELAEHDATVLPGDSLMARVFNAGTVRINSSHKKRCLKLADGFKVTAQAADGVIEAYEHVSRPIFGFQFHPEYHWQRDRRCLELLRQALIGAVLPQDAFFTKPDYVVYVPKQPKGFNRSKLDPHRRGDSYNDHFQVIWDEARKRYYAFWTQASWEGAGDHHVCFSKSADGGKTWSEPLVLAGNERRDCPRLEADWQQPMLSKTGRLYCLWNQRVRYKYGADTCLSGFYSDDGGETWSQPCTAARPAAKLSAWNVPIYTTWINWQRPLRLGKDGRYFVGCSSHGGISFWRFENIDENPDVVDIKISSFMDGTNRLTVANMAEKGTYRMDDGRSWLEEASVVKLPDGRLFALMRSSIGHPVWSQSRDGGETWSPGKILRDADGKPYLHSCSPCPIYDWKGPEAGSGAYFALIHDTFDFSNTKTCYQVRGPLYLIAGRFDPKGDQPIRFVRKKFFAGRTDGSWNSFYTSYTVANGEGVLWYPDIKYYLLGRKIGKEWFKGEGTKQ